MDFVQRILGGQPKPSPSAAVDDDFADFAGAPPPSPASILPSAVTSGKAAPSAQPLFPTLFGSGKGFTGRGTQARPYTKWYRVWERTYVSDFYAEMWIFPIIVLIIVVHFFGARKNKRKVRAWVDAYVPILQKEFASVGVGESDTPVDLTTIGANEIPYDLVREKTLTEYVTYATGRQNVAFVDIKLSLKKRFNPASLFAEEVIGFFFESQPATRERMEATAFVFDGRETTLAPALVKAESKEKFHSTYDGFVWGVIHKDAMKRLRDGRYDLSLTTTKDNPKLPLWATVMSESAEITDLLLTPELLKAIEKAGDALEALIISDQSIDQPKTIDDTAPKKRISLAFKLPSSTDAAAHADIVPLFTYFIRLADILSTSAHFRPDVMRRIRTTREDEIKKIKKAGEETKAEERKLEKEKEKKKERDEKLKGLSSAEQKKFLERERAADIRRSMKGRTVRA